MYKFLQGNEREIEDKINEAVVELPNARIVQPVMPYSTTRGVCFCTLIEYGEIILPAEENTNEAEGANDEDKTGNAEKTDGAGKKAT